MFALQARRSQKLKLPIAATLLLATAVAALPGCGPAEIPAEATTAGNVFDFDAVFGGHCSGCHGAKGELGPAPPLNDPLFLAIISADELTEIVSKGRSPHLMPAFEKGHGGPLTSDQITELVAGIRSRWGPAAGQADKEAPPYSVADAGAGGNAAGQKRAGEALFAAICAKCHGKDGGGTRIAGPLRSPPLLAILSDHVLRRIVITGRPDLGMPDYRDLGGLRPSGETLSSQEVSQIVAFVTSWRESPVPPNVPPQTSGDGS